MKTIYSDSFFGIINKCLYYGLRVLIIFLFSKSSTTNDFASFVYVLNIVEICRLFLDFGIDSTYTRKLAVMTEEETKTCIEIIISHKFILSFIISCLIIIFCYSTSLSKNVQLFVATAFILPLVSVNSFVNIIFQSKNNNRLLSAYYFTAFLFSGIVIFLFNKVLESYIQYALMESLFFLILLTAVYKKTRFKIKWVTPTQIYKSYQTSFYNGSTQTIVTFYSKTDLLFIQKLSSAINVAFYGFFVRILDPLIMIASALAISAYSFFSRHMELEEKSKVAPKLRQYLLVTFVYAFLTLGAITFFLPALLELLKSKYQIDSSLAFFFGLATATRIISAAQGSILLSMGKFNYTLKIALINICSLFPFYFLFIPNYNIKGVLMSIVASELICIAIKSKTLKPVLF